MPWHLVTCRAGPGSVCNCFVHIAVKFTFQAGQPRINVLAPALCSQSMRIDRHIRLVAPPRLIGPLTTKIRDLASVEVDACPPLAHTRCSCTHRRQS